MKSDRSPRSRVWSLLVAGSLIGLTLIGLDASGVGRFLQGFEVDRIGWFDYDAATEVNRRPSGFASLYANGIASASGSFHARLTPDLGSFGNCVGSACSLYGPFTYFNRVRVFDGVTNGGSNIVTSNMANFTNKNVGFTVVGGSIPQGTVVTSVTNAHTIVLSQPAGGTASSVTLSVFPVFTQGYATQVDVYLDTTWAAANSDKRFDWDSALRNSLGYELSDYVFNVGTQALADPTPGFWIATSMNLFRDGDPAFPTNTCPSPGLGVLGNVCRAPIKITTSGWYTFRHIFRVAPGTFELSVELTVLDQSGTPIVDKTIFGWEDMFHAFNATTPTVAPSYGWFANQEIPELAIDNALIRDFDSMTLSPASPPDINLNATQTFIVSGFWETNPSALAPGLSPSDVTFTHPGVDAGTVSIVPSAVQPLNGTLSFDMTGTAVGSVSLIAHVGGFDSNAVAFTVLPILPTVSISNLPASKIVGQSFTPTVAYTGDGMTFVTSSTPSTCAVSSGVVTFVDILPTPTCTLVAHSTATTNYFAATGSDQSITVIAATSCLGLPDCWVDVVNGNNLAGGDTASTPKKTIQAAVDLVQTGGTVHVAPGIYPELVTIPRGMTMQGAKFGVDARLPGRTGLPATESVVTGNSGTTSFYVQTNGVTIDGFTVQDQTNVNQFGAGLLLGAGTYGSTVVNNIVQNNVVGIMVSNSSGLPADQTRIQHNVIRNNNNPTTNGASGHGIYTDQFVSGGILQNVLIDANTFTGNGDATNGAAALGFSSTDPLAPAREITITNNLFDGNARGLYAFSFTSSTIDHNTFQNATWADTADIRLFEGVSGLSITNNTLLNGAGRAIRITNEGSIPALPDATGVSFNFNSITGYTGPASTVEVIVPGYSGGPANGTCNWWGNASGPSGAGPGTGSSVSSNVSFVPWLSTPAGPCGGLFTVTIEKFVDGAKATTAGTGSASFPMVSSWVDSNTGPGNGSYTLDQFGFNSINPYEAVTSLYPQGSSYTTSEATDGPVVGSCALGAAYELVGYSTGASLAAAQAAGASAGVPTFASLIGDRFVIVWNKTCVPLPTPTIAIANLPSSGTLGGSFTPTYTYTGDGVTSTESHSLSTCTVSGGVVSFVGTGPCVLQAHATATSQFNAADGSMQQFPIVLPVPAVTITNLPVGAISGGSFVPAFATASNGATSVTTTSTACTVSGATVLFVGFGPCTLVAHTAATSTWAAGTGMPQTFTIGPLILINNIPSLPIYGGSFTPTYTYAGDGMKSTTSNTPSTCTVHSGVVKFVGAGTCTLVAHATATAHTPAATGPLQSFTICQKSTTISIKNIPSTPKKGGSFTPAFNYAGDGTTSVTSNTTSVCTVSGGVVKFVAAGTCSLTAHATAGVNYLAANGSPQSFTVKSY